MAIGAPVQVRSGTDLYEWRGCVGGLHDPLTCYLS